MSEDENKTIVLRSFFGYDRGELDTVEGVTSADFIDHNPLPGQASGIEGVKQASAIYRTAFPDAKVIVEDLIAKEDKVVIRWTARGTHKGEFLGVAPNGRYVDMHGITIFRVVNGKIVEQWGELNLFGIMQQIGYLSAPAKK